MKPEYSFFFFFLNYYFKKKPLYKSFFLKLIYPYSNMYIIISYF